VYPESIAIQQRKDFALLSAQLTHKVDAGWAGTPAVFCAHHHVTQSSRLLKRCMQSARNKVLMAFMLL
jgi:hypothetical protein